MAAAAPETGSVVAVATATTSTVVAAAAAAAEEEEIDADPIPGTGDTLMACSLSSSSSLSSWNIVDLNESMRTSGSFVSALKKKVCRSTVFDFVYCRNHNFLFFLFF